MSERAFVVGVGMTKFEKPGRRDWDYPDMGFEAGTAALEDAGIAYDEIEQVYAGYVFGDTCNGQRAVYALGLSGIPIVNVNNACSTGSCALFLGRQAVRGGLADCVLAVGFEKMEPGSIALRYADRAGALDKHLSAMYEVHPDENTPFAAAMFANAGREHMEKYGSTFDHYAWIGWKNHKHSTNNPRAQFQTEYTIDEIKESPMIHYPVTKLECSPTSDGGAAAIVASERFVDAHALWDQAVEIVGQSMVTDLPTSFDDRRSCISIAGADMTRLAAKQAYEEAQVGPEDVQVIELHDCFSTNELITYEALGLAEEGTGHELVESQDTTYGGRWVVNPSGGLIAKGHPIGATGLAQCAELCWQLRGEANARQVEGAEVALQHNIGLGGAAVVSLYRRAA